MLDIYTSGSLEIPGKYFTEFQHVPFMETPIVKADPEFWKLYLDHPILHILTAKKIEMI
jgi:hypothetical protein